MDARLLSAAGSHVGRVRASNQDSGYAGTHLFMVADGMGGHAGGDVASSLATQAVTAVADELFDSPETAQHELVNAIIAGSSELSEAVREHPELAGMGTTVSAMVRHGNKMVIAHIGDSRIYLLRDGVLDQITTDHTFVQRLVETGRITADEALGHPRRNVLMRVLGDFENAPIIDSTILDTQPGDRWLLCSDGLCGYVPENTIARIMLEHPDAGEATTELIQAALDRGAPDNVTVVIVGVTETAISAVPKPILVGSASLPLTFSTEPRRTTQRISTRFFQPRSVPVEATETFEADENYLDKVIAEDRKRAIRRRILWAVWVSVPIALLGVLAAYAYQWTQEQFYIGADEDTVVIYQGVQQGIGSIPLSTVHTDTGIRLDSLPDYVRVSVIHTITVADLNEARSVVERIANVAVND